MYRSTHTFDPRHDQWKLYFTLIKELSFAHDDLNNFIIINGFRNETSNCADLYAQDFWRFGTSTENIDIFAHSDHSLLAFRFHIDAQANLIPDRKTDRALWRQIFDIEDSIKNIHIANIDTFDSDWNIYKMTSSIILPQTFSFTNANNLDQEDTTINADTGNAVIVFDGFWNGNAIRAVYNVQIRERFDSTDYGSEYEEQDSDATRTPDDYYPDGQTEVDYIPSGETINDNPDIEREQEREQQEREQQEREQQEREQQEREQQEREQQEREQQERDQEREQQEREQEQNDEE